LVKRPEDLPTVDRTLGPLKTSKANRPPGFQTGTLPLAAEACSRIPVASEEYARRDGSAGEATEPFRPDMDAPQLLDYLRIQPQPEFPRHLTRFQAKQ